MISSVIEKQLTENQELTDCWVLRLSDRKEIIGSDWTRIATTASMSRRSLRIVKSPPVGQVARATLQPET